MSVKSGLSWPKAKSWTMDIAKVEILLSLITCKFALVYINILAGFAFILWYKVKWWSDVKCEFGQIKHRLPIILLCWWLMQVNGNNLRSSDEVVASCLGNLLGTTWCRYILIHIFAFSICRKKISVFNDFRGYLCRCSSFFCIMCCWMNIYIVWTNVVCIKTAFKQVCGYAYVGTGVLNMELTVSTSDKILLMPILIN